MRLTVFGSTGRTGRQVLAGGNRRGHRITAFTRRPDTIADPSTLAAIVSGDGRDPDAVRAGIAGTDAVIAGKGPVEEHATRRRVAEQAHGSDRPRKSGGRPGRKKPAKRVIQHPPPGVYR
jgi:putative NADH-flavin reductase